MSNYGPSFTLTRLYRKKSEKGTTYFIGRLGGARVALLKSNETADDGGEVWNLVVSEAPQSKRDSPGRQQEPQQAPRDWQAPPPDPMPAGGGRMPVDDAIPFGPEVRL